MNIPYAPVVFKEFLRYQEPGTKDTIITQCVATVYSKAQAEFIRNHTFFNILYFEQLEEGKSYSSQVADKLVQCYETVRNMTDLQVKNKCLSLGIIINTTDFSILRKKLAQAMAKLSVEDNDAFQRRFIEDTNKFNELKQTRVEQTYL